jgi:hypothetical protein
MDPSEARDHLELADRIVAASTRELCLTYAAPFFIVWGIAAGTVDLIYGLILRGVAPDSTQWIGMGLLVAAVVFSAVYGRRIRAHATSAMTFLEREFLNVLWIAMAVAFVANVGAVNLFTPAAIGALYTIAASIVLFYIGLHANRRALIGGIVLIVSLVVAGFNPAYADYVLCAGFYIGYAGFGVAELAASA